jgi:hypothetical protein
VAEKVAKFLISGLLGTRLLGYSRRVSSAAAASVPFNRITVAGMDFAIPEKRKKCQTEISIFDGVSPTHHCCSARHFEESRPNSSELKPFS